MSQSYVRICETMNEIQLISNELAVNQQEQMLIDGLKFIGSCKNSNPFNDLEQIIPNSVINII